MRKSEQSLLLTSRENYVVPKGQEHRVHCKVARLDDKGNFLEPLRLRTYGVKGFDTIFKENMEKLGYTLEILYHPQGKYSGDVIRNSATIIAEKDAEIEALKAQLEAQRASKPDVPRETPAEEQREEVKRVTKKRE